MISAKYKIASMARKYKDEKLADHFKNRLPPVIAYAVYIEYERDEYGEYTYFIGEWVESFGGHDTERFEQLVIPASYYQKFTTCSAKMPDVVVDAWQNIWQMRPTDSGANVNILLILKFMIREWWM